MMTAFLPRMGEAGQWIPHPPLPGHETEDRR